MLIFSNDQVLSNRPKYAHLKNRLFW